MQIGRKLYYLKSNGQILLDTGEFQASTLQNVTEDEDFQSYAELKGKSKDDVGVIQLDFGQLSENFNKCTGIKIDMAKNPIDANAIVFDFTPPQPSLEQIKQSKMQELENVCDRIKNGGFASVCLGTSKIFDSTLESRDSIMGLAMKASMIASGTQLTDTTLDWKAKDEPVCYPWTPQQIMILGVDLSTFMTKTIKHKEELQQYVNKLTNIEDIQKVTWDTAIPN